LTGQTKTYNTKSKNKHKYTAQKKNGHLTSCAIEVQARITVKTEKKRRKAQNPCDETHDLQASKIRSVRKCRRDSLHAVEFSRMDMFKYEKEKHIEKHE
jgi:hypothetical protein